MSTISADDITLLMSVHNGEGSLAFDACLESLLEMKPSIRNAVIVIDGWVRDEIRQSLSQFESKYTGKLTVTELAENQGLGVALNQGLEIVDTTWVMRMDSDDICVPDRLHRTLEALNENPALDIIGGYISEFEDDPGSVKAIRRVPLEHQAIHDRLKVRSAMNHVTVCYRRDSVVGVGGYKTKWPARDYDLWVKMLMHGFQFGNIKDVLVKVRADASQLSRRKGWKFIRAEIGVQFDFYRYGFISFYRLFLNVSARVFLRLLPNPLMKIFYIINRRFF